MAESFFERNLAGARFERVDLRDATFEGVYLAGARFHWVDLSAIEIRGAIVRDVAIHGSVDSLTVNGIDVVPLIEAELDRLYPERRQLRPTDAAGFREAWRVIEDLWAGTVSLAQTLDPALLHERVGGEWSFIETLRHLLFATDAWVGRALLGNPSPWDPLDLPFDEMPDTEGVPRDRAARPSLDAVLALRAGRMATVAEVIGGLTDAGLDATTTPVTAPGWPRPESYPVRDVLLTVIKEEWWHRHFAERDPRGTHRRFMNVRPSARWLGRR